MIDRLSWLKILTIKQPPLYKATAAQLATVESSKRD